MVEESYQGKALKHSCYYSTRTAIGYTVQKIWKALSALAEAANIAPLANLVISTFFSILKRIYFL